MSSKPPHLQPVWTLLAPESVADLVTTDQSMPPGIAISKHLPVDAALQVPMVRATRCLIERALAEGGLRLTGKGYLSRADTAVVFDAVDWPTPSKAMVRSVCKVINEYDMSPIHCTRHVATQARLFVKRDSRLVATKLAQKLVAEKRAGDLFASLFESAYWRVIQASFDVARFGLWPQDHAGVILWCLGISATSWQAVDDLLPICTIPSRPIAGLRDYEPGIAFFSRVIEPAIWLGLLDYEERSYSDRRVRKASLFDQALVFSVRLAEAPKAVH